MVDLCKYSDISGKPGTGIHTERLFGFASFDTIVTALAGLLINYYIPGSNLKSGIAIVVLLFVLGIFSHRLFCVHTTLTNLVYS